MAETNGDSPSNPNYLHPLGGTHVVFRSAGLSPPKRPPSPFSEAFLPGGNFSLQLVWVQSVDFAWPGGQSVKTGCRELSQGDQ